MKDVNMTMPEVVNVGQDPIQLRTSVVTWPGTGLFIVTGQNPTTGEAIESSLHDTHEVLGPAIDGDCELFLQAIASIGDASEQIASMPIPAGIDMSDLLEP